MSKVKVLKTEIRELYNQLNDKVEMQILLAELFGIAAITIKNHWFGRLMSIPEKNLETVKEEIKKAIEEQSHAIH